MVVQKMSKALQMMWSDYQADNWLARHENLDKHCPHVPHYGLQKSIQTQQKLMPHPSLPNHPGEQQLRSSEIKASAKRGYNAQARVLQIIDTKASIANAAQVGTYSINFNTMQFTDNPYF